MSFFKKRYAVHVFPDGGADWHHQDVKCRSADEARRIAKAEANRYPGKTRIEISDEDCQVICNYTVERS